MISDHAMKVAVIGAGITGITTAYSLLKRGCDVTVYDRHAYAAMETSFANGGQLSASNAEVWNRWATLAKGVKWAFSPGAPLLFNAKPSWQKLSWIAEFVASIPKYEENTITAVRLALKARNRLLEIAAGENIAFDCERRGILHFYRTKAGFENAARVTKLLAKGGLERVPVTASQMSVIEPALCGDFFGGFYTPSDFTGDIHLFSYELANACIRYGAAIKFETLVTSIAVGSNQVGVFSESANPSMSEKRKPDVANFDKLVICAGVGSRHLANKLGDHLKIYPVKGYSITVPLVAEADRAAAPRVGLLDDEAKIVTSRLGPNRFRVAGTAEINGYNRDIRSARIGPLISWCRAHLPEMSTREAIPWAGLRPMTPDMLPRVSVGRNPRVFYNTGHGHLGWTMSAATAEAVATLVLSGS
jgi:D-amino-acid dehydrogenase